MIQELIELEKEFNDYKDSYESLLNRMKPLINKSKISKGFLYNIRDFEKESMGFKKGKELKSFPKNLKDVFVYNFNNKNEIIEIDIYGSSSNIIDKEFCIYESVGIKTYYYNGGAIRLRNVTFTRIENDKTIKTFSYGTVGSSIKDYVYDESGILEKILVKSKQHNQIDFENSELIFSFSIDNEIIQIIQSYPNGYKKDIYK